MKIYKLFFSIILLAVLLVWVTLFISNGLPLLLQKPAAIDYLAFYTGGQLAMHNSTNLYDLSLQQSTQRQLDPASISYFLPFFNPPFVAFFLIPLTQFPLAISYSLFVILNTLILVLLCILTWNELKMYPKYIQILSIVCIIFFIPVLTSLLIGQLTFILTLLFFITWLLLKKQKDFIGGLVFSLVLIKPHFFLLPFLAFIIQKKWRFLCGLSIGSTILFIISIFLIGWKGVGTYFDLLLDATHWENIYGISITAQHSLQTFFLILLHGQSAQAVRPWWIIAVTVVSLFTLLVWRKRETPSSPRAGLQFAVLIIATILISPHTHFHDLMLLIVVGVIIGHAQLPKKGKQFLNSLIIIGYAITVTGYIGILYYPSTFRSAWILINVVYMLALFFILVLLLRRGFGILHTMDPLFIIKGTVQDGAKRGRDLGFPTANVLTNQSIPDGIYVSQTTIAGKTYPSATFIGAAQTFDETEWKSETYILDFNENIYGQKVTITLLKKLRENKKFTSIEKLVLQMKKDIKLTREFFKREN